MSESDEVPAPKSWFERHPLLSFLAAVASAVVVVTGAIWLKFNILM